MRSRVFTVIGLLLVAAALWATGAGEGDGGANSDVVMSGDGPSWSWDTSPVTLDWYMNFGWYGKQWNVDENELDAFITDKTGVSVNIQVPAGDGGEKLSAMIAADDLPDLVTTDLYTPQNGALVRGEKVYDLASLVDQYAPTFSGIIPPSMSDKISDRYGGFYFLLSDHAPPERMSEDELVLVTSGAVVRQDLLDELGLTVEDFDTREEFIESMRLVRDANLSYNGLPVAPLYFSPEGGVGDTMDVLLPNFFGIRNVDATGDYVPTVLNPRYSEVIAFANQLYREDVLTEENFTSQRKQIEEKIASGQVFAFVGNAIDYRIPMQTLYANDPAAKFVPVGAIRTGNHPPTFIVSTGGWATTAVTSQADDPARAVRFLEYLYSEEGQRETMLGVPDNHWTLDEQGRERWTPEVIQIRSDDQRAFNEQLGIMTFWWTWDTLYKNRYVQYQYQEDADLMWMDIQTALVPYVTISDAFVNIEPDPASELGITFNEVELVWERELTRAMIAPSRADAIGIYEEAVDTMMEMGYGDVVDHMNEQFQQNREKYGIDSVY